MELSTALAIIVRWFPEAVLQDDHICTMTDKHDLTRCPFGSPAAYTNFDAMSDTPLDLEMRLAGKRSFKVPIPA
jgi:hypothetical protein